MKADYYGILGITADATPDEIRGAYFDAARKLHPDANPDPTAHERFLLVQEAYEALADPERRAEYDAGLDPSIFTVPSISINIRTSRAVIPRLDEPQTLYAMVDLSCTAEMSRSALPPTHVCLVIDRSTSMAGQRMDMVKANIARAVKLLKPDDIISVVAFSDRADVVIPPTKMSAFSKVENKIYMIQTGGGTEIFQGLFAGLAQLRSNIGLVGLRQMILLTDGHTYGDESACLSLAQEASVDGILISALGIGHEWSDQFLDRLTGYSGGTTFLISSPKDMEHYFEQKMSSLDAAYARNISLEFQNDLAVELRYAFRMYPDISALPVTSPIPLGNLTFGKSLTLLLEMVVHPIEHDIDILDVLQGRLKMQVIDRIMKKSRMFLDLRLPVRTDPEPEPPPAALVEALSRLTLYRMQEKARQEVSAGDYNGATKHLQYLATHLLSRGNQELAHTVLVEAEHIRQSHMFSKDGDKRIKYGTRALMLPAGSELRS